MKCRYYYQSHYIMRFVGKNVNVNWFFTLARLGKSPHPFYSKLLLLALILEHAL
jgi:hypothetical protein